MSGARAAGMMGRVVGMVVGWGWGGGGEGDEGLGAVAVEIKEESRVPVGVGKSGKVVCFLRPVRGVGLGAVMRGEKVGVSWEGVLGRVRGGIEPEGIWKCNVNLNAILAILKALELV